MYGWIISFSRSASSRTMRGLFPPSSRVTRFRLEEPEQHWAMKRLFLIRERIKLRYLLSPYITISTGLNTVELWISRSSGDQDPWSPLFIISIDLFHLTLSKMQPIRVPIVEANQFNGRTLIGRNLQQRNPNERIRKKIKRVHSGYRDLAIGVKDIQYKSCQLWSITKYLWDDRSKEKCILWKFNVV